MALYLEQGEIAPEQLHAPFEKALREGHLVPVCFVSARTGAGVAELLDVLVKLAPNPTEGNPPLFFKGEGDAAHANSAPSPIRRSTCSRTCSRSSWIRSSASSASSACTRARSRTDTQLFVGDGRKPFKVGHLFMLQGGKNVEIDRAVPGDIAAVAKVDEIDFDCVLHDSHDEDHIHMQPLEFPHADAGRRDHAEAARRRAADLRRAAQDDRRGSRRSSSSTTHDRTRPCCAGWASCTCARCSSGWRASSSSRSTRGRRASPIARRSPARPKGIHRHKKQTGGAGQFGEVYLRVEPRERGAGFEFVDQTSRAAPFRTSSSRPWRRASSRCSATGAIAGFPLQDVRVIVYDGKHHPVDSKEVAFVSAGKKAFLDAIEKARPIVLEPVVSVEVICPEANTGDIAGDLSSRRGQVTGTRGCSRACSPSPGSRRWRSSKAIRRGSSR